MSTIKVDSLVNGGKTIDFTYNAKVGAGSGALKKEYYEQSTEPTYPCDGALWFNTSDDTFHIYANNLFYAVPPPPIPFLGDRGLFGGGYGSTYSNVIDYVAIPTPGNATDFGDLTATSSQLASFAGDNSSKGLFAGGYNGLSSIHATIDIVTISTPGNGTDFGDLLAAARNLAACSNGPRGVIAGGQDSSNHYNVIQYVTIASPGNATDFGDLLALNFQFSSCSSDVRGLFVGGRDQYGTVYDVIQYITIASTGNATDFGNLTAAKQDLAACSNKTRGVIAGGNNNSNDLNVIEYITIATTGNATDFGDLTAARQHLSACANNTRGVFAGGGYSPLSNVIDYITIATTGNATDFGDLTVARADTASGPCSGN